MNFSHFKCMTLFLAIILLACSFSAWAQEDTGNLAEVWVMTVDMDSQPAFEEAFKSHLAVRKEHEDPFTWNVYTAETGDDLSTYLVRACCFSWADKDAYDAWSDKNPDVENDWSQNVHPHVAKYGHHYSTIDFANSHWPEGNADHRFVGVTDYHIKTGHASQFAAIMGELSQIALNEGWAEAGHHWAWSNSVDGTATTHLVIPYKNYADMADPDPTFYEFLSQHLGSEQAAGEMFQRFNDAMTGSEYHIYEHRSDLSMSD